MKCSKYDTDTAIPKESTVAEKLTLMGFHLQNMRFHREEDPTRHGQLAVVSKVIPKVKEMKEEEVPPVERAQAPSTEGDIKLIRGSQITELANIPHQQQQHGVLRCRACQFSR